MIYINGHYKEASDTLISHRDSGFSTGIGIFDSMLAVDGKPIHPQEHYERIIDDVECVIGLSPPYPPACGGEAIAGGEKNFVNIIHDLLDKNNLTTGYARIRTTVTGGEVKRPLAPAQIPTILIDAASCDAPPEMPVTCAIINDFPRIAGCVLENCKRLDYSRSYAARRKAESLGAEEAILTNTDGNIACGAASNIFIEESGVLITPPLSDGVLAGVTRRKILESQYFSSPPYPPACGGEEIAKIFLPTSNWEDSTITHPGKREDSTITHPGKRGDSTITSPRLRGDKGGRVLEESISPERLHAAEKIYLTNSFIGLRSVTII